MSRNYTDNPTMEPIFFTPPERLTFRGQRLYGGGGGGGTKNYKNLENLYEEQALSARLLREQAERYLPGMTDSYASSAQRVLDPGYADKQAGIAAADMASANAMERAANERSLASMGVNPNDPRFASSLRSVETNNAARLAAGQNIARNDARNYQLNVAKDAVGTFTGQSNQAANQMGDAASGLGSIYQSQANMKANQDAATQNAVGSAVGGGMMAYSMFAKDGGRVGQPPGLRRLLAQQSGKTVERHMLGGQAGGQQGFAGMQQIAPPPVVQRQQTASPVQHAMGTANQVKQAKAMYDKLAAKKATTGAAETFGENVAANAATSTMPEAASAAGQAVGENVAANTAAQFGAGEAAVGSGLAETGATAAADAALSGSITTGAGAAGTGAAAGGSTALAGSAAATGGAAAGTGAAAAAGGAAAAGTAAAGGAMATIGAAVPWIGAAMAVGSLLELWADGGEVGTQTHDIRSGGKVPGEWEGNVDDVPALLVKEEHVLNAEAAKLAGHGALEALNKKGLALRNKGKTPDEIKTVGLGALV